jgi:hypothetical protein
MKKATFHMIAGLLAIGLVSGVNFAQAQAGTLWTQPSARVGSSRPASLMASQESALLSNRTVDSMGICLWRVIWRTRPVVWVGGPASRITLVANRCRAYP